MKHTLLTALVALSLSAPAMAADYFVVVPMPGKVGLTPPGGGEVVSPDPESPPPSSPNVQLREYALPVAERLTAYSFDLNSVLDVTGDVTFSSNQVAWQIVSGELPQGLSLTAQGAITGAPQVRADAGVSFEVQADYKGVPDQQTYLITVLGAKFKASQVAAGSNYSCALSDTHQVWCWGVNTFGQLGTGASGGAASQVPVNITAFFGNRTVVELAANNVHTCARTNDHKVWCWGASVRNGFADHRLVPTEVPNLAEGARKLALGSGHTCALTQLGGVKCWGYNIEGALGDGTGQHSATPVALSSLGTNVSDLVAGLDNTCAKKPDGWWCWGVMGMASSGWGTRHLAMCRYGRHTVIPLFRITWAPTLPAG